MFFGEKKESNADFLVKLIIFLGALSAIFVAVALLIKKYNKKLKIDSMDELDFDDDDFCYDCCDFDDCDDCGLFEEPEEKVVAEAETASEENKEEASTEEASTEEA